MRRLLSSDFRWFGFCLVAVLAIGLFAAACGGDAEEAEAPAPASEPAPSTAPAPAPEPAAAPTIAKKGGVYVGTTSQGKSVRLRVSASGTTGKFSIGYESSDPTCVSLRTTYRVRISKAGKILDTDGDVLGAFASRRLAKGRERGATPSEAKTTLCPVTEAVTWQARLR